jgi:hypothetical protein
VSPGTDHTAIWPLDAAGVYTILSKHRRPGTLAWQFGLYGKADWAVIRRWSTAQLSQPSRADVRGRSFRPRPFIPRVFRASRSDFRPKLILSFRQMPSSASSNA